MINRPILVVMAAGMGSRYGGLKQIDPIGPKGELIIEYSVYDAIKAGFGKIIFVIKEEMLQVFKEVIGNKMERVIDVEYIFQDIKNIPKGFQVPEGRIKPWGTGHAILCCKDVVNSPFAVINADDYYGQETYKVMSDFLNSNTKKNLYAMAGFVLEKTLTEAGTVARGICQVDKNNNLISIEERTKIKQIGDKTKYTIDSTEWFEIRKGSIVSMNLWGFNPSVFNELENGFKEFLKDLNDNNKKLKTSEYYLPTLVNNLLLTNKGKVKVLKTDEQWYGVTYKEDKEKVKLAIKELMDKKYPENLWEEFE